MSVAHPSVEEAVRWARDLQKVDPENAPSTDEKAVLPIRFPGEAYVYINVVINHSMAEANKLYDLVKKEWHEVRIGVVDESRSM